MRRKKKGEENKYNGTINDNGTLAPNKYYKNMYNVYNNDEDDNDNNDNNSSYHALKSCLYIWREGRKILDRFLFQGGKKSVTLFCTLHFV